MEASEAVNLRGRPLVFPQYNMTMAENHGGSGAIGSTPVCDSGEYGFEPRLSPDDYWLAGLLEGEGSFMKSAGGVTGDGPPFASR